LKKRQEAPEIPAVDDAAGTLKSLLGTPDLGSKEWIYRQYDHSVRANTVVGPGAGAAVLLLKGTPSGLALTSDVNPVYCSLDPRRGGAQAVAEAVRNLACVGAEPIGLTDCLNFGNPENPEIAWQFRECVEGMAEACRALEVPVISGNVSFYNETEGKSILPTPTVAMVGIVAELGNLASAHFQRAGDRILLLGEDHGEFGGSAYLRLLHGIEQGRPPAVDLGAEERLADFLRVLSFEGWISTAQDLSDGGLAVALAEATFGKGLGAEIDLDVEPLALFSETQARAIVAVPPEHVDSVLGEAQEEGVPALEIGSVGGDRLRIRKAGLDASVAELREVWATALPRALDL
jgi:phosphoribosylformylglycinamidine synthase